LFLILVLVGKISKKNSIMMLGEKNIAKKLDGFDVQSKKVS